MVPAWSPLGRYRAQRPKEGAEVSAGYTKVWYGGGSSDLTLKVFFAELSKFRATLAHTEATRPNYR